MEASKNFFMAALRRSAVAGASGREIDGVTVFLDGRLVVLADHVGIAAVEAVLRAVSRALVAGDGGLGGSPDATLRQRGGKACTAAARTCQGGTARMGRTGGDGS